MVEELDGEHQAGHRPETKISMMLMIWEKHEPAVDPSRGVLALAPPLALLQLPLPHQLALSADQPGGLVQREEDVVAGVRVRQEGGEVEMLAEHFEHEGNGVGEEVGEGEGELDGEILATDRQERVLRVAARTNQRIVGISFQNYLLAVSIQLNSFAGVRSSNSFKMNWKRQVYGTKLRRSGGDLKHNCA